MKQNNSKTSFRQETLRKKSEDVAVYHVENHCLVVELKNDLDHHSAMKIREKSDAIIARENIRHIVFDFTNSNFMDSSGIGVIMGRYKQVIFSGGKLAVTGITPPIDRIFRVAGLYRIINKYETVRDAIKAF